MLRPFNLSLLSPQCAISAKEGLCKESRLEGPQERGTRKLQGAADVKGSRDPAHPSAHSLATFASSNPDMNQKGKCEPPGLPVGTAGVWRRSLGLEVAMQTG